MSSLTEPEMSHILPLKNPPIFKNARFSWCCFKLLPSLKNHHCYKYRICGFCSRRLVETGDYFNSHMETLFCSRLKIRNAEGPLKCPCCKKSTGPNAQCLHHHVYTRCGLSYTCPSCQQVLRAPLPKRNTVLSETQMNSALKRKISQHKCQSTTCLKCFAPMPSMQEEKHVCSLKLVKYHKVIVFFAM